MDHAHARTPSSQPNGAAPASPRAAHAANMRKILAEMSAGYEQFAEFAARMFDDLQLQVAEAAQRPRRPEASGAAPADAASSAAAPGEPGLLHELLGEIRSARAEVRTLHEEMQATRTQLGESQQRARSKLAELLHLAASEAGIS